MAEYLAPGVYVEETSFRAKSIEGVSTSTTAFVGPTRRGPTAAAGRASDGDALPSNTPELVTSYADFERIYGGFGPVDGRENYLAHAVRAYFNEGGARLYVARVFTPLAAGDGQTGNGEWNDGRARSRAVLSAGAGNNLRTARFVARFPGQAGNGRLSLRKIYQPASAETLAKAYPGSFVRVGGQKAASAARVASTLPAPFAVADASTLELQVNGGQPVTLTFRGLPAEITSNKISAPLNLAGAETLERTLRVTVNGGTPQDVVVDARAYDSVDALAQALTGRIDGVEVSVTDGEKLTLRTVRRGIGASLSAVGAKFGFKTQAQTQEKDAAKNTVPDLRNVTVTDLNNLLREHGARASVREGRVEISTIGTGATSSLRVAGGSGLTGLGLTAHEQGEMARGEEGPARGWFRLEDGRWVNANAQPLDLANLATLGGADLVTLVVETEDGDGQRAAYEGLALGPGHPRFLGAVLGETPSRRSDWLEQPYAYVAEAPFNAHQLHDALFGEDERAVVELGGGNDGDEPTDVAYQDALRSLLPLEEISILAAPGHTALQSWAAIQRVLISHVERPRAYQIAVLDTPEGGAISGARDVRSRIDSKYAALYFPWVTVANPQWRPGRADVPQEINLPPSGFLAGIYARNDVQRGVHKAPANEVVRAALRFETDINFDEQGELNPMGVNCLRFFPGRGYRVWGARTVSSDPEWKYVNVRRYFNYVERSIDVGTQWAVFEPNGEALWANVRQTISSFLYNEWRNGALLGTDPKEAYFVKCDRTTMTQNDLDNGRLVCLVGVAVVKPAEFVIFRIGQKTADARE
ncbi:phage tail sheath subtilisin-like domain-containing protein [Longimicrobium sp.]|uniref:phage tail sheath subtilisin-like domain-containing protein n=1 Tax=Longimicrobium sp. TaxID=2029185 RepID=UPI002E30FDD9|nr:phage tail sheath subtilisin-like domain-containing protein [Longimicrobium sp.]HEX6042352.1 phage tail sheath subtilisin-like domain-containing protein [Longimicrobium sp.]